MIPVLKSYQDFCVAVRESKLLDPERLTALRRNFENSESEGGKFDAGNEHSIERFARYLIRHQVITPWQARLILRGKFRGFFLGNYKILDQIGKGGMSIVYQVEHLRLKQQRAIKVLPSNYVDDSSRFHRFIREAQTSARLEHRNIVRAFDIDQKKGIHFIVMEYVDGQNLDQLIKSRKQLSFPLIADYLIQVCEGLQFAHDSGMIHRDIKPANLIVDQSGVVKILDLGLALESIDQNEDEKASLTNQHNDHLGTADYLAPEQALNSHTVDHRADLYSLGSSMYFLLTGQPPFSEGTVLQRVAKHQTEMPERIELVRPDCPEPLIEICWKLLQKKPDERFQSAADVQLQLQKWLDQGQPITQWTDDGLGMDQLEELSEKDLFAPEALVPTGNSSLIGPLTDGSEVNVGVGISGNSLFDTAAGSSASKHTMTVSPQTAASPLPGTAHSFTTSNQAKDELKKAKLTWMLIGFGIAVGSMLLIWIISQLF